MPLVEQSPITDERPRLRSTHRCGRCQPRRIDGRATPARTASDPTSTTTGPTGEGRSTAGSSEGPKAAPGTVTRAASTRSAGQATSAPTLAATSITRRIIEAERPLLTAHGLSMWGYIALSRLSDGPAYTQLALARAMDHDRTRLIALLDELEGDGLLTRQPDPADRRARIVRLTPKGRAWLRTARSDIHAMEDDLVREPSAVVNPTLGSPSANRSCRPADSRRSRR
jgi:DNA-binding MarR family transcriptional regulator